MNKYKTRDLYFAAYLMTMDCTLTSSEWEGPAMFFHFASDQSFDELRDTYYAHTAAVDPFKFASNIKMLKSFTVKQ
jgi:hypothetical protein